jgi:hypothetical protein
MQFSQDDTFLYLAAGDEAKVKVFALPIPPTPSESTTHPQLDEKFTTPVPLTHTKAASGVQALPNDRLLFSQSSLTSPNDVFIIRDLKAVENAILSGEKSNVKEVAKPEQLTHLTKSDLDGKHMSEGEEIWFEGARQKNVQGWALKPRGWKPEQNKKYPAVLLIHGGEFAQNDRCSCTMDKLITLFQDPRELGRTNGLIAGTQTVCGRKFCGLVSA